MAKEYIERDALLDIVEQQGHVTIDDIIYAPTADVVEVKHGRWDAKIMHDIGTYTVYWCSVCNCCSYFKHNYCPNCGADMRERMDNA